MNGEADGPRSAHVEIELDADEDRAWAIREAEGIWAHTEKPPGHMPGPIQLENRLWAIECAVGSAYRLSPEGRFGGVSRGVEPEGWVVREWADLSVEHKRLALEAHKEMPWRDFSPDQREIVVGNVLASLPRSEWASGLQPVPSADPRSPEVDGPTTPISDIEMPEPEP